MLSLSGGLGLGSALRFRAGDRWSIGGQSVVNRWSIGGQRLLFRPCLLALYCSVLGRVSLAGYRLGYRANLDCRAIVWPLGDRSKTK